MAIQIINDPYRSVGASVGQSVGGGLGSALSYLANKKVMQLEERQRKAEQRQLFEQAGYTPEQAALLAGFGGSPEMQLKLSERLQPLGQQQQPEPTYFQQQPSIAEYQEPMAMGQQPQGWAQALERLQGGPSQDMLSQLALSRSLGLPEIPTQMVGREIAQALQQGQLRPELTQQQLPAQAKPMMPQQPIAPGTNQPGAPLTPAQQLSGYLPPAQKIAQERLEQKERHFAIQQEREREKIAREETKEIRKEINASAKAAKQDLKDLERFEELEKSGKLDTPGYVEFLHRSGLDIPALLSPESQEFQKISANFLRDAKQYFGARVSNYEIEQFLKTIPSLSQSPEGRKRVIANLKYLRRSALEYKDALKEIVKENKGVPPIDLADQIDDRIDKRLDKLAEKFKEDIAKPVPKGQNRLITALQATAGSVLGAPGAILGAASKAAPALTALV